MIRIRTSLDRAVSEATEAESAAKRAELERDLWLKHRAFVIRQDDPEVPKGVKMMAEGLAKKRFG